MSNLQIIAQQYDIIRQQNEIIKAQAEALEQLGALCMEEERAQVMQQYDWLLGSNEAPDCVERPQG